MNKSTAPINAKLGDFLKGIMQSDQKNAKCWYRSQPRLKRDLTRNEDLKAQYLLGK